MFIRHSSVLTIGESLRARTRPTVFLPVGSTVPAKLAGAKQLPVDAVGLLEERRRERHGHAVRDALAAQAEDKLRRLATQELHQIPSSVGLFGPLPDER